MENRVILSKEEAKVAAKELLETIEITLAVLEVQCPGNKDVLLDAMIDELEEVAGRKKPRIDAGVCRNDAPTKNATEPVTVDFGNAIRLLKAGHRLARKGWNGKGQYVELAHCISYTGNDGTVVNASHQAIGNRALAFVGTSGVQLGWLASQADMLAEDWIVVG